MAGIGFELRKLLKKDTLLGLVEAYAYAGVIGSGPWVFSIVGILMVGIFSATVVVPAFLVTQFQTSVTYLVASSLIVSGLVQLAFTRFVSDRLFAKEDDIIHANLNGLMLIVVTVSALLGTLAVFLVLPGENLLYRIFMLAGFVLMCAVWVMTVFLSGMRQYKAIVLLYGLTYTFIVALSYYSRHFGLEGLLGAFVLGHVVLLGGMWILTVREFAPKGALLRFDFAQPDKLYPTLMIVGCLYNLAVWADKFMFWYYPNPSVDVNGLLRSSVIYDLSVFISYLSIIPGMAVFLVRIETDFVEYYDKFFDAVRSGGSLQHIEAMRDEMVFSIRQGLAEIAKIQTLAVFLFFVAGPAMLRALGISELYLPLLYVQVVAAALQVGLMSILNVFFYLDQRRIVVLLCVEFLLLNVLLTAISLWLGAAYYGYGLAFSVLLTLATGLYLLNRKLQSLEYETFMLQRA